MFLNIIKLITTIVIFNLLFSGCANTNQPTEQKENQKEAKKAKKKEPYPPIVIDSNKSSITDIKFYINDDLVKQRNKEVLKYVVNKLKEKQFRVTLINKITKIKDSEKNKRIGVSYIGGVKILNNDYIVDHCLFSCDKLVIKPNQIVYNENEIMINGLKNKKEIVSVFDYIQKNIGYYDDDSVAKKFGVFPILHLDYNAMENGEFKVRAEYGDDSSLKKAMHFYLKNRGFKVVSNENDADYKIIVENLGYGRLGNIKNYIKFPQADKNYKKSLGFSTMEMGTTGLQNYSSSSTIGKGSAFLLGAGLMLSLFDSSSDIITTVNAISIYDKKNKQLGQLIFPMNKYWSSSEKKYTTFKNMFGDFALKKLSNSAGYFATHKIDIHNF